MRERMFYSYKIILKCQFKRYACVRVGVRMCEKNSYELIPAITLLPRYSLKY